MKLGIFHTGRSALPRGEDQELWDAVQSACRISYDGSTENEPMFVAPYLAEQIAELARLHHEAPELGAARRALDIALLEFRHATNRERVVGAETALRVQAGRSARHVTADPHAAHLRADGARAGTQLLKARQQLRDAEQRAEAMNVALQGVTGVVADRMLVAARAAMPRLKRFVGLLNAERARFGREPLPDLAGDLAERLVLEACRRAGDPHHEPNPE